MLIKAAEALIAWNGANDGSERSPQDAPWGAVAVGPLLRDGDPDWTTLYNALVALVGEGLYLDHEHVGDAVALGLSSFVIRRAEQRTDLAWTSAPVEG